MKIFKTSSFDDWAKNVKLHDNQLKSAVLELEHGLVGVYLGANLVKKRFSLNSRGKSSGLRTVIAYRKNIVVIFLLGFSKNERENISKRELTALKKITKFLLSLDSAQLAITIRSRQLIEVL